MANRSSAHGGMFLSAQDREALLLYFAKHEKRKQNGTEEDDGSPPRKDGCRVCTQDNDHTNMLLCERCSGEYHFYCIGLKAIPTEDWFCDKCKPDVREDEDGLDLKVAALPPTFTSRFGQVVWAQGGPGYGWWPSYIYDPRMTVGGARELAKRYWAKRHLLYFFHCVEAPFSALAESKICEWYTGIAENYHLGKTARHQGKVRGASFAEALRIATLELGKPLEHRMDWNHPDPTTSFMATATTKTTSSTTDIIHDSPNLKQHSKKRGRPSKKSKAEQPSLEAVPERLPVRLSVKPSVRSNLMAALEAHNNAVPEDEDEVYLRVLRDRGENQVNVGFVKFGSRQESTFADARRAMEEDLDLDGMEWKFYLPDLGPISSRQEERLGPLIPFLQTALCDGDGTIRRPAKVIIIRADDTRVSY